jgi:hypothetical protein
MAILFGIGLIALFLFYRETMFFAESIDGVPVQEKLAPGSNGKEDPEALPSKTLDTTHDGPQPEAVQIDYSIPKKSY